MDPAEPIEPSTPPPTGICAKVQIPSSDPTPPDLALHLSNGSNRAVVGAGQSAEINLTESELLMSATGSDLDGGIHTVVISGSAMVTCFINSTSGQQKVADIRIARVQEGEPSDHVCVARVASTRSTVAQALLSLCAPNPTLSVDGAISATAQNFFGGVRSTGSIRFHWRPPTL